MTILTSQVFSNSCFFFLKNLADHDLTEHQITQILTLSQLHATSGEDKGNPTVHTHMQHVVWTDKGNPTV